MAVSLKRIVLGDPLHNEAAQHQRLSDPVALAVFASDALSSVAYATGEILLILALAIGTAGEEVLQLAWPISLAIGVLLVVVVLSYRQIIRAYPEGGGAYVVAHRNLGEMPGLIAGASLLVDYILTVAVSVSAAVAALTSALPELKPYTVPIALGIITILAVMNLRGVREAGAVFAVPTYVFILTIGGTLIWGFIRLAADPGLTVVPEGEALVGTAGLTLFLVLRAFSSGCTAMTGTEAISNGSQAFRDPIAKHAVRTLLAMAAVLLFLFLGTTYLAVHMGVQPTEETVLSQLGRTIFGGRDNFMYVMITISTMLILSLAANTSYNGFPRLASFMAEDDYLPHQLKNQGFRLVYSNGVIILTAASGLLITIFGGNTTRLIPLYAVGVFLSFTLAQSGMVKHWLEAEKGSRRHGAIAINGFGAILTAIVVVIFAVTKFTTGAWIVLIVIPALVAYFLWVKRSYDRVAADLALDPEDRLDLNFRAYNRMHNHVIVLVKGIDRRVIRALQYAKSLKADVTEAVYVDIGGDAARVKREWDESEFGIPLKIIDSPFREVIGPIRDYVRSIERPTPDHVVTVILPEYAPKNTADAMLHDQTSFWIKQTLFSEEGVIVTDVPYHLGQEDPDNYPQGGTVSTAKAKPVTPRGTDGA